MNYTFNLGNFNISIPVTKLNPEISVNLSDVSIDIKDVKLTDTIDVIREVKNAIIDISNHRFDLDVKRDRHDIWKLQKESEICGEHEDFNGSVVALKHEETPSF